MPVIILGILIILCFYCSFTTGTYELKEVREIESLDVLSGVYGHFTLGTGYVESKPTYYFYIKTNDGYHLETLKENKNVEQIIVKQDSDKHYLEIYEKVGNFWQVATGRKYIIIVPENTIIKEFNANIK